MNELLLKKETIKSPAQLLPEHIAEYVETYARLASVKATRKAVHFTSAALATILVMGSFIFCLLFMGVWLAIWIGESLHDPKAGYLIVSGACLLCVALLL